MFVIHRFHDALSRPLIYNSATKPVDKGHDVCLGGWFVSQAILDYLRLDPQVLMASLQDAGIEIARNAQPMFVDPCWCRTCAAINSPIPHATPDTVSAEFKA
jgi:hypothetical protein